MEYSNNDKDILILHSNNDNLFNILVQWATQTNCVILYNPPDVQYDSLRNLVAVVIDREMIESHSIPEKVSERVIPAELNESLILKILNDLKPGAGNIHRNRIRRAAGYA